MKKLFTILCAATLTLSMSAQTQWGATAGLNMANVSEGDGDMKPGVHIGISADVLLSDAMSLKTGALYSMKGSTSGDVSLNINYIEIPCLLSFAVSDQMSLMVGTYTGFLMGANASGGGFSLDLTDAMSGIDFGIDVGAGFAVSEVISINAGYQIGLTALDKDGAGDSKNSNIHIGMTYSFGG